MVLNHPAYGEVSTEDLRADVEAFKRKRSHYNDFGFTAETVEMLLNKIQELQSQQID